MTLSDEMIEEAARAMHPAAFNEQKWWSNGLREELRKTARAALTAVLPALRKQVLEEAANECESEEAIGREIYPKGKYVIGRTDGADSCAARIRFLMDKE